VETKYLDVYKEIYTKAIEEIDDRLGEGNETVCFIYQIFSEDQAELTFDVLKTKLVVYKDIIDIEKIFYEIKLWSEIKKKEFDIILVNSDKTFMHNLVKFFSERNASHFVPNLSFLLRIYMTMPVTSVSPERSFSCLKRLKTYLRNTMEQNRLSDLAILAIEKELTLEISLPKVIDIFGQTHRKFDFIVINNRSIINDTCENELTIIEVEESNNLICIQNL